MEKITYSYARQNLAKTMDMVSLDKTSVLISRAGKESCVLMTYSEYESLEETLYLLRSPKNALRLLKSIKEIDSGKAVKKEIDL